MLKWLRKYNTWIMVVAGSLLMVTFLLAEALQSLGQASPRTTVLVVDGDKISAREFDRARIEYAVVTQATTLNGGLRLFGIEDAEHWLLLTREAEQAGLVGGPEDGEQFIPTLARQITQQQAFMLRDAQQYQDMLTARATAIQAVVDSAETGAGRVSRDEMLTGLSKLQGVFRLRALYQRLPRLSDRRLVSEFRRLEDSAAVDYVFIPPERELGNVERPGDAQLIAHFDKYKDVEPGEGEHGFGYKLPDRVKLEYLTVSRSAAEKLLKPDPIEVQKRFRLKFKDGVTPEGTSADQEIAAIESQVRLEKADRVLRLAEQTVRAEFDKALRNVPQNGAYWRLPDDWAQKRPTMTALRDTIVQRVRESMGIAIEAPVVNVRGEWTTQTELATLESIGQSFVMRGTRGVPFTEVAMSVKEVAGEGPMGLQAGVLGEPMSTRSGDRVFFVITDARKASAPESLDEVRDKVVGDVMKLEAFNRLKARLDEFRAKAAEGGLEALSIKPEEAASMGGVVMAAELPINKATVRRDYVGGTAPNIGDIDHEPFRDTVLASAQKLDPTTAIDQSPVGDRIAIAAIPQSLGIGVAKITGLNPVTAERLRAQQNQAVNAVTRELMTEGEPADPFSLEAMRKRLNVEDRRPREEREPEDQDATNAT